MINIFSPLLNTKLFFFFLLSIFLVLFAGLTFAESNKTTEDQPVLQEIPHPNLSGLEQVVVDQLNKGKHDVEVIAKNPLSDNKLKALTFGKLGHLYHAYDFIDAAAACYYNASQLQPEVYRWNYCVAFIAQKNGDFKKALAYYMRSRSMDVTTDLIYLINIRIGECYQSLNDLENANHAFQIAYTLNPQGPTALARLGELYLAQKEYDKAVNFLNLALSLEPSANKLHYPLAMAYRRLGNKDLAKQHLDRRGIVGIQPPDPLKTKLDSLLRGFRVHILEGKSAYSAKRYEEAAESFKKAIAEDPSKSSGWVNLGATNAQLFQPQEALSNFEEALRLDPENMTAHYNMGDLCITLNENKKAIEHLSKFVQANPEDGFASLQLARAYRNENMAKEAIDYYQQSLNIDHAQVDAWFELVAIFEDLSAFKYAVEILELGVKKLPREKRIKLKLAYSLTASPDKTARNGKRALEIAEPLFRSESNYQTAKLVAMSHAELNQCDQAQQWLDKALDLARASFQNENTIETLRRNKEYIANNNPCSIPL